ncbi:DNA polymerase III subunit delta [candidate division KSB1 bacterium]|nr:DNA polymerase III subunit delta [candidate division KSB1 bacterium]
MDLGKLTSDIKKGAIAPVYFFYGDEKYLVDQAAKIVIDATISPEVKDFNFDVFYGNETDMVRVIDIARSFPMMADRRVIVIKEAQKLAAKDLDVLATYLSSPVNTTCLVVTASTGQVRGKAFNALKKDAVSIEFKQLYDNQVPAWIMDYVKQHGYMIGMETARKLHAYAGNSILNLVNELEKIFLNLEGRREISDNDIQMVVGFNRNFTIFNLYDAVGEKRLSESLTIIDHLLEQGEYPTSIIIRLTGYFTTLLKVLFLERERMTDADIGRVTGVHPFFVKNYKKQAANYTTDQIEHVFSYLLEADRNLKTSYQAPEIIMDLLTYNIVTN